MVNELKCSSGIICGGKNNAFIMAKFLDKNTNKVVEKPVCGECYLKFKELRNHNKQDDFTEFNKSSGLTKELLDSYTL